MTRLIEYALITGILALGLFAILKVADDAVARQDLIMQEGE